MSEIAAHNLSLAEGLNVLKYWRLMEMLTPPHVDDLDPRHGAISQESNETLPWRDGKHLDETLPDGQTKTWKHVVYFGVYKTSEIYTALQQTIGGQPNPDQSDDEETALAAIYLDKHGVPMEDTLVLSASAWATGYIAQWNRIDPVSTDEFPAAKERLQQHVCELVNSITSNRRMGGSSLGNLRRLRDLAADATGVHIPEKEGYPAQPSFAAVEIRTNSIPIVARDIKDTQGEGEEVEDDRQLDSEESNQPIVSDHRPFLNSFILEDLTLSAHEWAHGEASAPLRTYLTPDNTLRADLRVDSHRDLRIIEDISRPDNIPLGRWPSWPSALGQQVAVNVIHGSGPGNNVVGVNGPPGTGKTTLLREVIAAVVVERAIKLAALSKPEEAFLRPITRQAKDRDYRVFCWKPEFSGFEIVVASANNGAVENVTLEIPEAHSINKTWDDLAAQVDYFSDLGSLLLSDSTKGSEQKRAWALVAAKLGNKKNRDAFTSRFWFDSGKDVGTTMLEYLKGQYDTWAGRVPERLGVWKEAVERFKVALNTVRVHEAIRAALWDRILESRGRAVVISEKTARMAQLEQQKSLLSKTREQRIAVREQAWHAWNAARERWENHALNKPGFWEFLATWGRANREWVDEGSQLQTIYDHARETLLAEDNAVRGFDWQISGTLEQLAATREETIRLTVELSSFNQLLQKDAGLIRASIPDASWESGDLREKAFQALWSDEEWNKSRANLFLEALLLHKQFISCCPMQMKANIGAAIDIIKRPSSMVGDIAQAAWTTLFFVVPVVSTTFASLGRLFAPIGREAIGWVLVDEAGQATPQQVVGALHRAKRAVAVGDPLQLTPITTVPFDVEDAIRNALGVSKTWLTCGTSVQKLADRVSRHGTYIKDPRMNTVNGGKNTDKLWIGAPLTVHRRCDRPMFDFVNEVVYDGLMVFDTSVEVSEEFRRLHPNLPESCWVDVCRPVEEKAGVSDDNGVKNWVESEGAVVKQILVDIAATNIDPKDVMLISPFRNVANELRRRFSRYEGLQVGTVHTGQGKQADVVIIVLGGTTFGACEWAAEAPNLINVAVSRAKRRLYVVGARSWWANQRYFSDLAARLSVTDSWNLRSEEKQTAGEVARNGAE